MTQLIQQRPWAVWCLFLAGAFTGGIASSLLQPQSVLADPADLNGQKFAELESRVASQEQLLDGVSRDELGRFVVKDPLVTVELLVDCDPESSGPALKVCGPVLFESMVAPTSVVFNDLGADLSGHALKVEGPSLFTGDPGPDTPLVAIDPLTIEPVTALKVLGHALFTGDAGPDRPLVGIDPLTIHPGKPEFHLLEAKLAVEGPAGLTIVGYDHIELLVRVGGILESAASLGYDELGSYLGVDEIFAGKVSADEFEETGGVIQPF